MGELISETFIQVRFNEDTKYGNYSDALYFTQDQYALLTPEDINALAQARVDAWADFMSQPVLAHAETLEELKEISLNVEEQISSFQIQLQELRQKIAVLEE